MRAAWALAAVVLFLALACGPGWEGYEDEYSEPADTANLPSAPDDDADDDSDDDAGTDDDTGDVPRWEGDQVVFVKLDAGIVEAPLAGLPMWDFRGEPAVSLSQLVESSGIAADYSLYRYDFTATDGYDLLRKRYGDVTLLPRWIDMQHGYLYDQNDLTAGWTEHPWGSAEPAYRVKYMNGGTITLLFDPGGSEN